MKVMNDTNAAMQSHPQAGRSEGFIRLRMLSYVVRAREMKEMMCHGRADGLVGARHRGGFETASNSK